MTPTSVRPTIDLAMTHMRRSMGPTTLHGAPLPGLGVAGMGATRVALERFPMFQPEVIETLGRRVLTGRQRSGGYDSIPEGIVPRRGRCTVKSASEHHRHAWRCSPCSDSSSVVWVAWPPS